MRSEYDKLINDFCQVVGLEDEEYVRDGGAFEVDGVVSSLIYNEQASTELMFLYVDFGMLPPELEAAASCELLKRNFLTFTGKGPAFTISPITGRVVYVEHFQLDSTDAEQLARALSRLTVEANDWRKTYFLSGPYALVFKSPQAANTLDAPVMA